MIAPLFFGPVVNHLGSFERHKPSVHHLIENRQETIDLFLGVHDFHDQRQIKGKLYDFGGVDSAARSVAHWTGLSGLATGASWLCYFRALQLGDASQVAPVDKLSVVLVLLFAALFLGEKMYRQTVLGAALIVGGVVILSQQGH
jgi:hypothetical protein